MGRKKFDPLEFIKNAASQMGLEVPDFNQFDEARREADSVVLYVENPNRFRERNCKQCSRRFATSYSSVAMCSDRCRREWLHNVGIEWNLTKTQAERWAGNIPLVIQPEGLAAVKQALSMD